jgi:hypothetical protein
VFDKSQKYELECMRLAADCTQLASDVHNRELDPHFLATDVINRALEIHFLKMAKVWTALAEQGPYGHYDETIH